MQIASRWSIICEVSSWNMICVRLRAQKGEPLYTRSPAGAKAQWRTAASHSALSLT